VHGCGRTHFGAALADVEAAAVAEAVDVDADADAAAGDAISLDTDPEERYANSHGLPGLSKPSSCCLSWGVPNGQELVR
jgi:hypothetical protein